MQRPSTLRTVLGQVFDDWQFVTTFAIGMVILAADVAASQGWELVLRAAAFSLLALAFGFYLYRHIRMARLLHGDKPVPLLLTVGTPRRDALRNLERLQGTIAQRTGFKAFRNVERFFNVHYEDLLAHRADRLPPNPHAWADFLEDAQQEVRQFLDHVSGERVYHVAVRGPSSLALGMGAILSTKHRLVAYQYSEGDYVPVLDLTRDLRRIKTAPSGPALQFIKATYPSQFAPDVAVVLDMAGHVASGDVRAYLEGLGLPQSTPLVEVSNTYGGNLTADDWTPVVQELFAVFNHVQRDSAVRRIHLFHAMPVALALGLGMALGTFVDVTVYNWEQSGSTSEAPVPYFPVLHLPELRGLL